MAGALRTSFRSMVRSPGVSAIVIATLATGIAVVTIIFTMLNGWAWAALPYPDANRIVAVGVSERSDFLSTLRRDMVRELSTIRVFDRTAAYKSRETSLRGTDEVRMRTSLHVEPTLFRILGATPLMGRLFDATDERDPVAVIAYNTWKQDFGSATSVIGRTAYIDGVAHTVVGVLPEMFAFERADVFVPLHMRPEDYASVLAHLAPGVTHEAAQARVKALKIPSDAGYGGRDVRVGINTDMAQRDPITRAGFIILIFACATVCVLLIACANVASLLMARGAARRRQYSVRAALGADSRTLFLENLGESGLLVMIATGLGVLVASWGVRLLVALLGEGLPSWLRFPIDAHVAIAAGSVALFVVIAVGWLPARRAAQCGPMALMQSETVTRSVHESRFGQLVVIGEIALSATLFVGTLLLFRSFNAARTINVGYNERDVAVAEVNLTSSRFRDIAAVDHFIQTAKRSISTTSHEFALSGDFAGLRITAEDTMPSASFYRPLTIGGTALRMDAINTVSDGFFRLLGLNLIGGRTFTSSDARTTTPVVVVSAAVAHKLWPNTNAAGKTIRVDSINGVDATVIGVVSNRMALRPSRGDRSTLQPLLEIYFSERQSLTRQIAFMSRSPGITDPRALANAVEGVDQDVAMWVQPQMLYDRNRASTESMTIIGKLFGSLAAAALALAIVGLFGIIAYATQQRTREIGIRMALGAAPHRIAADIMQDVLIIVVIGLSCALILSMIMALGLRSFIFGVGSTDPVTYLVVALAFVVIALLATWIPSRRALRIDPMKALRP